jgi:hypothetical protein
MARQRTLEEIQRKAEMQYSPYVNASLNLMN